jgi:hypothetical protein
MTTEEKLDEILKRLSAIETRLEQAATKDSLQATKEQIIANIPRLPSRGENW